MPQEIQCLALINLLEQNHPLSKRELAQVMGGSLGKVNYCLKALSEKGFVKFDTFRHKKNKSIYAYLLTPAGLQEITRIVRSFFPRKEAEYNAVQQENEALRRDFPVHKTLI